MASDHTREILASGVPRLDEVLGGGIPRGHLLFVIGAPGSGKTTLACQVSFAAAARGQTVVFLSTLSEPAARLARNLRTFAFWDPRAIGRRVVFESVFPLAREGMEPLVRAMVQSVQARGASVLVIDGFCTIRDLHPDGSAVRTFVSQLAAQVAALGCTTLITSSHVPDMRGTSPPEFTMCDGIVELAQLDADASSTRSLRVWKMRGAASSLGGHTIRITSDGMIVYPRVESRLLPARGELVPARLSLGTPGLDDMMSGGLPRASCTLLVGAPGTGKSLAALQYLLEGTQKRESCVHVSFRELPMQLLERGRTMQVALASATADGRLTLLREVPAALEADVVIANVLDVLDRTRGTRIVVDSVVELERALPEHRKRSALAALLEQLRARGVTALIVRETSHRTRATLDASDSPLAVLADNIILMRHVAARGRLRRILSVLKMRDAQHDHSIRPYELDASGLRVLSRAETSEPVQSARSTEPSSAPSAGASSLTPEGGT